MRILNPGPKLTPADIRRFEREIGQKLPKAYQAFMLKANGGKPEPHWFILKRPRLEANWIDALFQVKFYSRRKTWGFYINPETGLEDFANEEPVTEHADLNSLWWHIMKWRSYLPPGALPFAECNMGKSLLFFRSEARYSEQVWIADLDSGLAIRKAFATFADFLAALMTEDAATALESPIKRKASRKQSKQSRSR